MKPNFQDFKQTDADNFQFGREIRGGVFQFKEFLRDMWPDRFKALKTMPYDESIKIIEGIFEDTSFWCDMEINLSDYNETAIENHISAYYKDLDELKEIYGEDWMFIVAECIFEQESGLY